MFEKTLPIAGPSRAKITITTIATNTKINAYSTRPCPFSLGANNIAFTIFFLEISLTIIKVE